MRDRSETHTSCPAEKCIYKMRQTNQLRSLYTNSFSITSTYVSGTHTACTYTIRGRSETHTSCPAKTKCDSQTNSGVYMQIHFHEPQHMCQKPTPGAPTQSEVAAKH